MGFPDNYTDLKSAKKTNRYQAIGNSWAVPVVKWIGEQLIDYTGDKFNLSEYSLNLSSRTHPVENEGSFIDLGKDLVYIDGDLTLNCTSTPENCIFSNMRDIVSSDAQEDIYISPVGCYGIVRRKQERNLNINSRLEEVLLNISSQMTPEEIEKRSRVQKRGRFSDNHSDDNNSESDKESSEDLHDSNEIEQISLFKSI